jgi:hypothetical protein
MVITTATEREPALLITHKAYWNESRIGKSGGCRSWAIDARDRGRL